MTYTVIRSKGTAWRPLRVPPWARLTISGGSGYRVATPKPLRGYRQAAWLADKLNRRRRHGNGVP